jgi:hypothetical protein
MAYSGVHLESVRRLSGRGWYVLSIKERVQLLSGISSPVESLNTLLTLYSFHFPWNPWNPRSCL